MWPAVASVRALCRDGDRNTAPGGVGGGGWGWGWGWGSSAAPFVLTNSAGSCGSACVSCVGIDALPDPASSLGRSDALVQVSLVLGESVLVLVLVLVLALALALTWEFSFL